MALTLLSTGDSQALGVVTSPVSLELNGAVTRVEIGDTNPHILYLRLVGGVVNADSTWGIEASRVTSAGSIIRGLATMTGVNHNVLSDMWFGPFIFKAELATDDWLAVQIISADIGAVLTTISEVWEDVLVTAAEIAALILKTPGNPIAANAAGAIDLTETDTARVLEASKGYMKGL